MPNNKNHFFHWMNGCWEKDLNLKACKEKKSCLKAQPLHPRFSFSILSSRWIVAIMPKKNEPSLAQDKTRRSNFLKILLSSSNLHELTIKIWQLLNLFSSKYGKICLFFSPKKPFVQFAIAFFCSP